MQGKTLKNIVITSWKDLGHWAYVALSRVKKLAGLYLYVPIDHLKCTGMDSDVRRFMEKMKRKIINDDYLDYDYRDG